MSCFFGENTSLEETLRNFCIDFCHLDDQISDIIGMCYQSIMLPVAVCPNSVFSKTNS